MPDRPAYLRIADTLREQIRGGAQPPGSRLPTMAELSAAHGVSEIVVRQAIAQLRGEGLVETRRGGGTVVRVVPPVRRVAMDRYRAFTRPEAQPGDQGETRGGAQGEGQGGTSASAPTGVPGGAPGSVSGGVPGGMPGGAQGDVRAGAPPAGSPLATTFTRDQRISWREYRLDKQFSRTRAGPELATLFELPTGTELLRRRFVFYARGEPQQISVNYLPWEVVGDTPVADPAREPWPGGTLAQLSFLGHPPTRVEEAVTARMPTPEEAETLRMGGGVPVFAVTRRMISGARIMEVCRDIVIPADRVVLDYGIDL
ncbi:GntR family transcriptional regulator [Actinomadura hibisca]|uniref:GntR family transcriptional regulator n=1 Tax=Actinomadura hibisca TaxID=68565 RepID=UPI000A8EF3EB|nr:GntR family transcriptional regulator [Actinomadura hibisca]